MNKKSVPDHTAIRVALWRAMHAELDSKPLVIDDTIGLKLAAPDESWKQRPDMHPEGTKGYRASIVGRARFIEDLVDQKMNEGVYQYVILGAGLDSFVQRNPGLTSKLKVFEIDEPATQAWKKERLEKLGYKIPENLHFVPVDFESGESWLEKLEASGFDNTKPSIIASTGVAMYLTKEANLSTWKKIASLAPGSVYAMTFMLPPELVEAEDRGPYEFVMKRAAEAGTPFLSLFSPSDVLDLAKQAGFKTVKHVSRLDIIKKYFDGRPDSLKPSSGEEFLIATT